MTRTTAPGRLIGVGTGPGDPELLTLKAVARAAGSRRGGAFRQAQRHGNARAIVEGRLKPGVWNCRCTIRSPPKSTRTTTLQGADPRLLRGPAAKVAAHLEEGRTVAVLSEGDPLFYGSYMHLHVRLAHRFPTEVVPGVTAMSGCWSLTGEPIVQGDDVLTVLPGTMSEFDLTRRLADTDAAVIMKVGRNLPKIRRALAFAGSWSAPSMSSAAPWPTAPPCGWPTRPTMPRPISASYWWPAGGAAGVQASGVVL